MNKKLLILPSLLILLLFGVSLQVRAQPPFITEPSGNPGLLLVPIEPPDSMATGEDYSLHIHVLNNSDGKYVNNSLSCFYHMTNVSGAKVLEAFLDQSTGHLNLSYYSIIKGGNFTEKGLYNVLIQCIHEPTRLSGVARLVVHISYAGKIITTGQAILYSFGLAMDLILLVVIFIAISRLPQGNTKNEDNETVQVNPLKYLTYSLYMVLYGLVWALFYILSNVSFAYLEDALLGNMFLVIQIIMLRMMVPVLIFYVIYTIVNLVQDKKLNRELGDMFRI